MPQAPPCNAVIIVVDCPATGPSVAFLFSVADEAANKKQLALWFNRAPHPREEFDVAGQTLDHGNCGGCDLRRSRTGAGIPDQADHADRTLARRRIDRYFDARDRRQGVEIHRPAHRHRQQGRRRRHRRPRHHGGGGKARRLHHRAASHYRVPPAADAGGIVGSGQGFQLHHPSHRLHIWRHHQRRVAIQELEGRGRLRQTKSRQGYLCDSRHRHLAACRDGADRGPRRDKADASTVQGRRRNQRRGARPAHHAAGRLRPAGGRWSMPAGCAC